jgi:metal-responsive CopG/Arc/MetJ family transcriptional regulator
MPEPEEKIISLRIFMPEPLKNEFKSVCAIQGKNMSEVVCDFVRAYVATPTDTKKPPASKAKRV